MRVDQSASSNNRLATDRTRLKLTRMQAPKLFPTKAKIVNTLDSSKWSDWSQCSEKCVRYRLRWNCDDLVASKHNKSSTLEQRDEHSRDIAKFARKIKRQIEDELKKETDDDSTPDEDSTEDDDGSSETIGLGLGSNATEGDREDQKDSCAGIDNSKTYQEVACIGGLCPKSELPPINGPKPNQPRQASIPQSKANVSIVSELNAKGE